VGQGERFVTQRDLREELRYAFRLFDIDGKDIIT
jgi:centrin-3